MKLVGEQTCHFGRRCEYDEQILLGWDLRECLVRVTGIGSLDCLGSASSSRS